MKRLLALSITLLVLFSGCSSDQKQSESSWFSKLLSVFNKQQEVETVKLAENQKEIYGKVKDIYGNIMELKLGTVSTGTNAAAGRQNAGQTGNQQGAQGGSSQGGMPGGGNFTPPTDGGFSPPTEGGGTANASSRGSKTGASGTTNSNKTGASGTAAANAMRQSVQIQLTGEEKTYTIPVTTPVYMQTTTSKSTLSFNQITKSKTVKLIVETDAQGVEKLVSIQILQ